MASVYAKGPFYYSGTNKRKKRQSAHVSGTFKQFCLPVCCHSKGPFKEKGLSEYSLELEPLSIRSWSGSTRMHRLHSAHSTSNYSVLRNYLMCIFEL